MYKTIDINIAYTHIVKYCINVHDKLTGLQVEYKPKHDLYALLHQVSIDMGRGPRRGLVTRPGQNKILKTLDKTEDGEMLQTQLKERLGVGAGTVSEILMKMEKEGFIERRRSNRGGRELIVSITEKGRIIALESRLSEEERDTELFGCLDEEDRKELDRILNKLLKAWHEDNGETLGERRERRWEENAQRRREELEIEKRLAAIEEKFAKKK